MGVHFNLYITFMNCMLHVYWKQFRLFQHHLNLRRLWRTFCGDIEKYDSAVWTSFLGRRSPWRAIFSCPIFILLNSNLHVELTSGSFSRDEKEVTTSTYESTLSALPTCDIKMSRKLVQLASNVMTWVGSIYNIRAIGSIVKQHDGLLPSQLSSTKVLHYYAKS